MISIKPMIGVQKGGRRGCSPKEVDTNIDRIFDGSQFLGYCLREPGAPICFTVRVAPTVEEAVRRAADARDAELWDGETYYDTEDRKIGYPPNIPKELLE